MKKVLLLGLCMMFLTACESSEVAKVQPIDCITKNAYVSEGAVLIDVRSELEFNQGNLKNSINIDVEAIANYIEKEVPDKDAKIIVYCRSGNRSATAAQTLIDMGYKNVYDLGAMSNCANE